MKMLKDKNFWRRGSVSEVLIIIALIVLWGLGAMLFVSKPADLNPSTPKMDGKYVLADTALVPLPSVVKEDNTYTLYSLMESGEKKRMTFGWNDVQFQRTENDPYFTVSNNRATVYLREKDRITNESTNKSDSSIVPIPFPVR